MPVRKEDILDVARLVRLGIHQNEIDQISSDLEQVMAYFNMIETLDLAGMPEVSADEITVCPLRKDEPGPVLAKTEALANAPVKNKDYFIVPRVIG